MHTLYRWEFSKIKNNLLTPLNAMSEEEMMPSAWISVLDGMPKGESNVLGYCPDELLEIRVVSYNAPYGYFVDQCFTKVIVTHWQPLPAPPIAEK